MALDETLPKGRWLQSAGEAPRTRMGERQAALADMQAGHGSPLDRARGQESQGRAVEEAARAALERAAGPLRLGSGESTRVVRAVAGMADALKALHIEWLRQAGDGDTGVRDRVLTQLLQRGPLGGESRRGPGEGMIRQSIRVLAGEGGGHGGGGAAGAGPRGPLPGVRRAHRVAPGRAAAVGGGARPRTRPADRHVVARADAGQADRGRARPGAERGGQDPGDGGGRGRAPPGGGGAGGGRSAGRGVRAPVPLRPGTAGLGGLPLGHRGLGGRERLRGGHGRGRGGMPDGRHRGPAADAGLARRGGGRGAGGPGQRAPGGAPGRGGPGRRRATWRCWRCRASASARRWRRWRRGAPGGCPATTPSGWRRSPPSGCSPRRWPGRAGRRARCS